MWFVVYKKDKGDILSQTAHADISEDEMKQWFVNLGMTHPDKEAKLYEGKERKVTADIRIE